ncbi:putative transcription factor [Tripterygium wilfordii]|uniref:Putative transcription factor n=1 Tax=Tripterygium wilfordii TaxID=458696 RepID=A0A7J7D9J6_TRIWF|nr:transcription factor bHLH68-like [Tripterygium wilfordii]KAF5742981.1 putative transcription factor [Tripterygium wilfordii]
MMAAGGNPNLWSINTMRPPPTTQTPPYFSLPPPPTPNFFPSSLLLPFNPSWIDHHQNQDHHQQLPESWSQLLLGGFVVGEEDRASLNHFQANNKKMEIWEEDQDLLHKVSSGCVAAFVDVKQEIYGHANHQDFQAITSKPSWSPPQVLMPVSPPKSCVTTSFSTTTTNNILDFSSKKSDGRHPPPDRSSSECNSTSETGRAAKKARVPPSSTQSPFKVRKEKLGDRITALHQLVSPFGKTDTASVLLEAIGYIRFLESQIKALSIPYLGSGSGNNNNHNMRQHHHHQQNSVQGERNCIYPEDAGQLLNENCMKRKLGAVEQDCINNGEAKKDLRSRGLCLVPVSCTLEVGSENGADYWAPPALGGGGFR